MTQLACKDDRRARNARIRQLSAMGWTLKQIGIEVDASDEWVRLVLKAPDPVVELALRVSTLQAELDDRQRDAETNRHRIRVIQRTLDRIDEEREALAIDRLLGLS